MRRPALRRVAVAELAAFILVVGVGVPASIAAPVPSARAEVVTAAQTATADAVPAFPGFGSAAIGAVELPGVLAQAGSQRARPIASITKVVTALVVLQRKPLTTGEDGPTITFSNADVAILSDVLAKQGSWQRVESGWRTSERQAIETMLIPSANNYAESLAIWAYGSVPAYLVAARAFLRTHHLDDTRLVDSNGLSDGDRSTPADLVDLGRLALADPVIAATVDKESAREPNIGEVDNTNELLGTHGVNGIKTGTTQDAGACLLFSAKVQVGARTVQLVGVILGASTHPVLDARVPALLRSVQRGLHDVPLTRTDTAYATYRTRWGGVAKAVPQRATSVLVWGRAMVQRSADVRSITGGTKGERVGTVTYRVQDRAVVVPLVLDRDVLAAPVWWRITHPLR